MDIKDPNTGLTYKWDRRAELIDRSAGDCVYRFVLLPTEGALPKSPVVIALAADDVTLISSASCGFIVKDGQYSTIVLGRQVSQFMPLPLHDGILQAVVFRIYSYGGELYPTVSTAPIEDYIDNGNDSVVDIYSTDDDQYAAIDASERRFVKRGSAVRGDCFVREQQVLTAWFARAPWDTYGDEVRGEVYGAVRFDLEPHDAPNNIPAWVCRAGEIDSAAVDSGLSAWSAYSGDYQLDSVVFAIPSLAVGAETFPPFQSVGDYISMEMKPWEIPFDAKVPPMEFPSWRAQAGDSAFVNSKISGWQGYAGDSLNGVEMSTMAWDAQALSFFAPVGNRGAVVFDPLLSASSVIPFSWHLPTDPLRLAFGVTGRVYADVELQAQPIQLALGLAGVPFAEASLATQPLTLLFAIDSTGTFKEGALPTTSLQVALQIAGGLQSVAQLQVQALGLVLGGNLGQAAKPVVFCMNLDSGGTSKYSGYSFDSTALIGSKYYGANDDGLFLLDGDDDAGEPIQAEFGYGKLDFGAANMKTIGYCYLGTDAGSMKMRVDSHVNGREAGFDYRSRCHRAGMREVRFDLGRGIKSTYIMPTFYNMNGDDFEVDNVRFLVAASDRRI